MPDRVWMPLLTVITQQSLDADYQVAAERRTAGERPLRPGGRRRTALLVATVIAVFGALISTAFTQTSRGAAAASADRQSLVTRVDARRERVSLLQERSANLSTRNARLSRSLSRLTGDEQKIATRNSRLQARTGLLAVRGEGIRIEVTESPDAANDPDLAVHDSDLALLANALWSAGAEAITVNGQRLTAVSSIRSSGPAIFVNKIGIAPPYTVEAIGDRSTLASRFSETGSGQQFIGVAAQYGFTYTMQNEGQLEMSAAPRSITQLRLATTTGAGGPDPKKPARDTSRGTEEDDG